VTLLGCGIVNEFALPSLSQRRPIGSILVALFILVAKIRKKYQINDIFFLSLLDKVCFQMYEEFFFEPRAPLALDNPIGKSQALGKDTKPPDL
jgi:hypothetical protein